MTEIHLTQIDAFSAEPFRGNPAAVCLLPSWPADAWCQAVAREMNLSETAFLVPESDVYRLRWWTPDGEVDLCGHATLASAHFLWSEGHLKPEESAPFMTLSGRLTARLEGDWIEMDFPREEAETADAPGDLLTGLGTSPLYVGKNRLDYLVEVDSEATLRSLEPSLGHLRQLGTRGVIVTSLAGETKADFVSRYFAPAFGIDEDPVTGSAHCCLGPYWSQKLGRARLLGFQASRRGGVVRVETREDRVLLGGQAVTVAHLQLARAAHPLPLAGS